MRTTLTLDPDVAEQIERLRETRGMTLKEVVNEALRAGLGSLENPPRKKAFRTRAVSLRPIGSNVDDIAEVLALAEGDAYR